MSTAHEVACRFPALAPFLAGAHHVDVEHADGTATLREFVAGMLSYQPAWLRGLFAARWLLVRLLGMRQEGMPPRAAVAPGEVSMRPGDAAAFFTVALADEERHWVASASESHFTAHLGVVVEPRAHGRRFHVVTVVHYHRWTGPVYFNLIRPFHHLVVRRMARAGARAG